MGFFDSIGKTISDVGQSTIQKGKEIADIAKYYSLISDEEKRIATIYEQIGIRYAEEFGDAPADSFAGYIDALKAANDRLAEYRQKVQELKGVAKCPACGAEVPGDALFCVSCGTKLAAPGAAAAQGARHCAGCGAVILEGSKFCTVCGKPVDTPEAASNAEENAEQEGEA